jgi:DNA-binding transcriptional MerR regulator
MAPKFYKAAEVCEAAQLQPFVLRSWEKEFPRIGVQKSADSPRLYRQSDLDQVLRIKDLVFREGLTLSGAKHRLEAAAPPSATATDDEVEEVLEALASDARTRIAHVRDGLRSILRVLSSAPGTVVIVDDDNHQEPVRASKRPAPGRRSAEREGGAPAKRAAVSQPKQRMLAKASRNGKPAKKKRSRANA